MDGRAVPLLLAVSHYRVDRVGMRMSVHSSLSFWPSVRDIGVVCDIRVFCGKGVVNKSV